MEWHAEHGYQIVIHVVNLVLSTYSLKPYLQIWNPSFSIIARVLQEE